MPSKSVALPPKWHRMATEWQPGRRGRGAQAGCRSRFDPVPYARDIQTRPVVNTQVPAKALSYCNESRKVDAGVERYDPFQVLVPYSESFWRSRSLRTKNGGRWAAALHRLARHNKRSDHQYETCRNGHRRATMGPRMLNVASSGRCGSETMSAPPPPLASRLTFISKGLNNVRVLEKGNTCRVRLKHRFAIFLKRDRVIRGIVGSSYNVNAILPEPSVSPYSTSQG